jgi:hypothetical protein
LDICRWKQKSPFIKLSFQNIYSSQGISSSSYRWKLAVGLAFSYFFPLRKLSNCHKNPSFYVGVSKIRGALQIRKREDPPGRQGGRVRSR